MAVDTYALTTLTKLKTYLGISSSTDDTLLEACIDRASDVVEQFLDWKVLNRDYTEWIDARGSDSFALENRNVVTVRTVAMGVRDAMVVTLTDTSVIAATIAADGTQVRVVTTASDGTDTTTNVALATYKSISSVVAQVDALSTVSASTIANGRSAQLHIQPGSSLMSSSVTLTMAWDYGSRYRLDENQGTMYIVMDGSEWWPGADLVEGPQRILVEYNAGLSAVPDDIEQACLEVAGGLYKERTRDRGLASESLGQYSYTNADSDKRAMEHRLFEAIGSRRRIR